MSAQVGVRTRARAALAMEPATATATATATPKRKNTDDQNRKTSKAPRTRSSSVAKPAVVTENVPPETKERCLSPTSGELSASCCSSNESTALADEHKIKLLDLEVETAQDETSVCNAGHEIERELKMSRSTEVLENSQEHDSMESNVRRSSSTARIMPTDMELEEFFAAAEKDIHKKFLDKYNYDVVKDVPMEGRYEWIQLKP